MSILRQLAKSEDIFEELKADGYTSFEILPEEASLQALLEEFSDPGVDLSIAFDDRVWKPAITLSLKETASFLDESSIAESFDLDPEVGPKIWFVTDLRENYSHASYIKKTQWFAEIGIHAYYVAVEHPNLTSRYLLLEREELPIS